MHAQFSHKIFIGLLNGVSSLAPRPVYGGAVARAHHRSDRAAETLPEISPAVSKYVKVDDDLRVIMSKVWDEDDDIFQEE